jgi:hypothetical protein
MPLNTARLILNVTILHAETLSLLKIAVSTIIECEKDNITARIVNCFTEKSMETIAPMAA